MTNENENGESNLPEHTDISIRYANQSQMVDEGNSSRLALFGDLERSAVSLDARVKDPIKFREAMSALYAVVGSDYRYVPKDRTAYQAYRRMRNESANMNAWQAQHAYFDWLAKNDPLAYLILDPVVTVHPDKVFLEAFSRDEGTYANLSIDMEAFDVEGEPTYGTTNIDFSEALHESIQQFRSYRETRLTIGQQAVEIKTEGVPDVLEKNVRVPDSWIRGFLQVQSATTLSTDRFSISAMDLYNTLRHLRMHGDQKGKRRGIRIELIPGEQPRLVLEPWETVLQTNASKFEGTSPKVIRIWGRRRLMMLQKILPYVQDVDVYLLGNGLPSFWVLKSEWMTFTLGMTGFTASNWSQAINFDLLLPRNSQDEKPLKSVIKVLAKEWSSAKETVGKKTKLDGEELVEPLQRGCQQGQIMFDVADQVYRIRPLTDQPLDLERLQFRSPSEKLAHDFVYRQDAISITRENRIFGTGIEITGKADIKEDRREYRPQILINDEGFVSRAECTCSQFRTQGLTAGPCPHLVGLRLAHAIREQERRSGKADKKITVETRTFSKREGPSETIYQLSLDKKELRVRWGLQGEPLRLQQLRFSSMTEARDEYFEKIDGLTSAGFLDATS